MPPTVTERYAVVSCHVERPLDDRVWAAFASFQERPPGGIPVAALMRPPDPVAGEDDEATWLERAHEASLRGPLGHHSHFTSPTHARPTGRWEERKLQTATCDPPGRRVAREGAWLRERGLSPTLFCGGGWYTDASVAAACAALGYVDVTPRTIRPPYLGDGAAWAQLDRPARIDLGATMLAAVPTTHGAGDLLRAVVGPGLSEQVHVYFHDTDLVDARRRRLIGLGLRLLARRRPGSDLDAIAATLATGPMLAWGDVARGDESLC